MSTHALFAAVPLLAYWLILLVGFCFTGTCLWMAFPWIRDRIRL